MDWQSRYYDLIHIVNNLMLVLEGDHVSKTHNRRRYDSRLKDLRDQLDRHIEAIPNHEEATQ